GCDLQGWGGGGGAKGRGSPRGRGQPPRRSRWRRCRRAPSGVVVDADSMAGRAEPLATDLDHVAFLQPAHLVRPFEYAAEGHRPAPDHVTRHDPAVAGGERDQVRIAPVHVAGAALGPGLAVDPGPDPEVEPAVDEAV